MIRSFIALPLPEAVRDALSDLQDDLQVGRPVPHENFHITIAYLDKQTPQTLERVHEVLDQIVHTYARGYVMPHAPDSDTQN